MHITFVCSGNTCRSPMAEGIFKKLLSEKGIENITCSSCGLFAFSGDSAAFEAVEAVKSMGVDISYHKSRAFNPYIIDETELFVCMTNSHLQTIKSVCNIKSVVLGDGIPDPYGANEEIYNKCAAKIKKALEILLDTVIMEIIPFNETHIKGVADLENECFSAPWSEESIKAELENENAHFLVAVAGDKILGYMGVHEIVGEGYVANIAVSNPYRRKGVANALMEKAENDAEKRHCEFISLEVRKSNYSAISLYEKRGYKVMGERKNFYSNPTENAIIMTLELNI